MRSKKRAHEDEVGPSGQAECGKSTKEVKEVMKSDPKNVNKMKHVEGRRKGKLLSILGIYFRLK